MPGFSGQGIVSIAKVVAGVPGVFRDIGNASIFQIGQSQQLAERNESRSGNRLPLRRLTTAQGGTLKIVGDEFNLDNFALATLGTKTTVTAGSAVVAYALPNPMVVGDTAILPTKKPTAVAVKDSTGTPKVLALNTNYTLDPFTGAITVKDLTAGGPYVQPLKADFTPGAYDTVGAFKAANLDYYVRLDGVNTDTGVRGICDCFRVRFSPAKVMDMISNNYLDFDLESSILADFSRQAADPEGQFYSFTPFA